MFLPSWQAIVAVYDAIAEDASVFERCIIYVLHSSLPMSEQTAVFEPAPPGVKLGVGWFCGYPLPRIVSCSMWCTLIRGPASHMPRMVRLDPGVQNVWTESRVTQLMQHIDGLACCTCLSCMSYQHKRISCQPTCAMVCFVSCSGAQGHPVHQHCR